MHYEHDLSRNDLTARSLIPVSTERQSIDELTA